MYYIGQLRDTNSDNLPYRQETPSSSKRKSSSSLSRPHKKTAFEQEGDLRNALRRHPGMPSSTPYQGRQPARASSGPGYDSISTEFHAKEIQAHMPVIEATEPFTLITEQCLGHSLLPVFCEQRLDPADDDV